jgi:hypothetical protein
LISNSQNDFSRHTVYISEDTTRIAVVEREDGLYHEIVRTYFIDRINKSVEVEKIAPIAFSPNLNFIIEAAGDTFNVVDLKSHRSRTLATGEDLDM